MSSVESSIIASLITAFCLSISAGYIFIRYYKHIFSSRVRDHVPDRHKVKDNTPTMGGLLILGTTLVTSVLYTDLHNSNVSSILLCLMGFGAIGAWDDWCKITGSRGIKARTKFLLQCACACLTICLWLWFQNGTSTLHVPYIDYDISLHPIFFVIWSIFVMVAMSNAVNLTDGLDGLALGSLIPNFTLFSVLCYLTGNLELCVLGAIIVGACLGFLWYNIHPACMFMGDVGSLSLGAGLACIALMVKQELLLIIAGAVFIVEVVSVIMQVVSFKTRGKRIFRMAPIHHHFELSGWKEQHITICFSIVSTVLCLLALMLYIQR